MAEKTKSGGSSMIDIDIEVDSKTDKAIEDFLKLYPKMAENIKDEDFNEVLDIVQKENLTFSVDTLRTNFVESLTEILKKMYESRDLKKKVTVINMLEDNYKKKKLTLWHPHGKTPEEQTAAHRITVLKKRKSFMFKLLSSQQTVLDETVTKVEENRKRMQKLEERRDRLNSLLDAKTKQLRDIEEECTKLRLKMLQ